MSCAPPSRNARHASPEANHVPGIVVYTDILAHPSSFCEVVVSDKQLLSLGSRDGKQEYFWKVVEVYASPASCINCDCLS